MIKEFKIFEKNKTLVDEIEDIAVKFTFDDSYDASDTSFFYFGRETSIIHQQDYAEDIYEELKSRNITKKYNVNLTLSQFKSLYKGLVEKSKEKILKSILEKPSLYVAGIENYVKLPKWIVDSNKYNM